MDAALVRQVWRRAGRCREYCQMPQDCDDTPFEIDHVIARKHGGPTISLRAAKKSPGRRSCPTTSHVYFSQRFPSSLLTK